MRASRDERRILREHFTSVVCHEQTLGLNPAELHLQKTPALISPFENMGCWLMNKNVAKRQILIACAGKSCGLASRVCEDQR